MTNENIKRLGIYAADRMTAKMPGLIFRSQREGSTGLNAHLEILSEGENNSRVVGVRIFTPNEAEKSARGYVCLGAMETAAYWLQHSLPVVLMVYEHERNKILWEAVTTENLEVSGKHWEVVVPYENEYGTDEAAEKISNLTCTSPYLARLAADKSWIEFIHSGNNIFLELDEWINQPNTRGTARLCLDNAIYQWPFQTSADMPHVLRLPSLFPWASLEVDTDFYREKTSREFYPDTLEPYIIEAGEIARFRFRMSLNELGRAFLNVEPFICLGAFPRGENSGYGPEYEAGLKFQLYNYNQK